MADEAFALSPISARAALPREEDYAAISEAFMETSRGRWFLTEYAKRNRNADTSMVLDAVARIEQSLAAQREENLQREETLEREESLQREEHLAAQQQATAADAEARLEEALAAIRSAVEAAQASAVEALDALALGQKLAPVRKGARVIREIAWRLREIGNDGRICDLIDSQVSVIEAGAAEISSVEAEAALDAAFASIAGRLAELGDDEPPAPAAETAVAKTVAVAPVQQTPEAPASSFAAEAGFAEAELAEAEAALAEADAALAEAETVEAIEVTNEAAADAHDEAILDMIAMEMGAPDPFEGDEFAGPAVAEAAHFAQPAPIEPEMATRPPEPVVAAVPPPVERPPQPAAQTAPEPSREISLGSSIIASGIVRKPTLAANDPLAPIRRMSQAEKIAFFS